MVVNFHKNLSKVDQNEKRKYAKHTQRTQKPNVALLFCGIPYMIIIIILRINVLYTYHILLLLQEIYNDKREIYGCSMVKGKKTTRQKEFIFQRK